VVFLRGLFRAIVAAAALGACAIALAQAPKPPAADDSPRFEIRRFTFDGATLIPRERLEALTQAFTGPARQFSDVQRALEAVERAYSAAGWSAVQVVLPEQELARGEIRLQIVEAKIGRVVVEGNKFFDEANVRASAPALAPGRAPNINEIARNLRIANENPSKQATVLLRSGQEEATVDAVLRVVDEKPNKHSVTVDNTGNSQTGKLRIGLGYQHANAFGHDDVLTLQYVTAPYSNHTNSSGEPDHLQPLPSNKITIFGAGYKVPLYASGDTMDFTFGYSNVNSGTVANLFSITGAGTIASARYTHNLDKIGDYEHRIAFSQDWRTYDNKGVRPSGGPPLQLVADITVHPFTATYLGVYRQQDSETGFSLGFTKNLAGGNDGDRQTFCQTNPVARNNGIGNCARADYEVLRYSFNHNRAIAGDWQARFAFYGQWTRDMLVTAEQFGIGGADSVRGFLERELTNDTGYRGTMEVYTPDMGGKISIAGARLRGLVFVDWGHVSRNNPGPGEIHSQSVWSMGPGLRFSRGTNMALRADLAVVQDQGGLQQVNNSRLHFSFSYIF
jgi:hemolysin activation/secretion protein